MGIAHVKPSHPVEIWATRESKRWLSAQRERFNITTKEQRSYNKHSCAQGLHEICFVKTIKPEIRAETKIS